MTAVEFLAVAIMLSTNYDERLATQALECASSADSDRERAEWEEWYSKDMQRIGAKRALWLDVQG